MVTISCTNGFWPTVVDIMVIWVKFSHSRAFYFADSSNVDAHSCHLLFDHFQFALIHGPNIPCSYAILLFTASDLASITSHIHNWVLFCFGSIPSFILELFLHWSPVAYWALSLLGSSSFSILSFCLFIQFMGFSRWAYWSGFPFSSPVDYILSDLSTVTCSSWVAPQGMGLFHWVRQGCGPCDQIGYFSVIMVSVCLTSDDLS